MGGGRPGEGECARRRGKSFPIESLVLDTGIDEPLPPDGFVFAGSVMVEPPDGKGGHGYARRLGLRTTTMLAAIINAAPISPHPRGNSRTPINITAKAPAKRGSVVYTIAASVGRT